MQKELETLLLEWRKNLTEIENDFLAGRITYSEQLMKLVSNQRLYATRMFDVVHQMAEV